MPIHLAFCIKPGCLVNSSTRFNSIRMITCVSSFIPFHSEAISIGGTQLLNIDFRDKDVILAKDIGQVAKEGAYTQFKSNQVL